MPLKREKALPEGEKRFQGLRKDGEVGCGHATSECHG